MPVHSVPKKNRNCRRIDFLKTPPSYGPMLRNLKIFNIFVKAKMSKGILAFDIWQVFLGKSP